MCWVKSDDWDGFCCLKQLSVVGISQALSSYVCRIWWWIPSGRRPGSPHPSWGRLASRLEGCAVVASFRTWMGIALQGRSTSPHTPPWCSTYVWIRLSHGRHINKSQFYQKCWGTCTTCLSFVHHSFSAHSLLASNDFGCNKPYSDKLSKWP